MSHSHVIADDGVNYCVKSTTISFRVRHSIQLLLLLLATLNDKTLSCMPMT